jgi:hypothetical protein
MSGAVKLHVETFIDLVLNVGCTEFRNKVDAMGMKGKWGQTRQ